ncbi:hypothetical protein vseg_018206 [Gypsophila vaccaria]
MAELKALLQQSIVAQANQESTISQIFAHNKMVDNRLAKLACSSFKSEKQPPEPQESLNATTLRSGTEYEGPEMPSNTAIDNNVTELAKNNVERETTTLARSSDFKLN